MISTTVRGSLAFAIRSFPLFESLPASAATLCLSNSFQTSAIKERARKGTRERKRKVAVQNKLKKEERLRKNPPPLPYKVQLMLKAKGLDGPPKPLRERDEKPFATDSVFFHDAFTWKRWLLADAVAEARLHYHPTMGNKPNALVYSKIELDLRGAKKDRYLEGFSKMVPIIHPYERGVPDRAVCAFVPTPELEKLALDMGAVMAGGQELLSEMAKGRVDVADIDYFVAHTEMAKDISALKGVLRDRLPKTSDGTIDENISVAVQAFSKGMFVTVEKIRQSLGIANEPDYGFCIASIGRLDMDCGHLQENLTSVLEKLMENTPRRKDPKDDAFLTRCLLFVERGERDPRFTISHPLIRDTRVEKEKAAAS